MRRLVAVLVAWIHAVYIDVLIHGSQHMLPHDLCIKLLTYPQLFVIHRVHDLWHR